MITGQAFADSAPILSTKVTAILAGIALLGIGQAGVLERGGLAKIAGMSLLGLGIYWIATAPKEATP